MISAVMPTYARSDITFDRGEGAYLYADDGRRYLDFSSGIAVTALGHSHPHLVEAIKAQAEKLWHVANLYQIPEQERLAERLVANSFADTVFFNNAGAEAIECGIKLVRKYQHETGHPERYRMICCEGAFHGRTLATIAAGGQEKHLAGFGPPMDGFDHVPFGNLNEMRAAVTAATAGILIEPIQGESGIRPADPDYLRGLRAAADEFGLLLFFDEVQCGMGRTGKLFAHEWSGVTPDVLATAKALGGGFPVAACMATENAAQGMGVGSHGSTFGGNPLAMAVANAVLDVILADGFLDNVVKMGEALARGLETVAAAHPNAIEEVRGSGLLRGIKLAGDSREMVSTLRDNGLLTVAAGDNVIRMLPPLIVEQAQIDEAMAIIGRSFADAVPAEPAP
ncbi:MAG: aspartate aminotransferase family protein [Alphaproteobacteria bacterium]|nr:aspartate aminotransferase family protein [Alphaproteobacteria bacterium]